jgi:hypothetical protein
LLKLDLPWVRKGCGTLQQYFSICGTRKDFKGYAAGKNLLKVVFWLALNKETKSSYRHGTAFLLSLIALFSLLSK